VRFINMMRQEVRIIPSDGKPDILIPSSGFVMPVEVTELTSVFDDVYGNIPVSAITDQGVTGMPNLREDVSYIVSWKVLQALRAQGSDVSDIYCPDTSVRDGRSIVGSRTLIRYEQ
jgi:hypothetical protein